MLMNFIDELAQKTFLKFMEGYSKFAAQNVIL